MEPSESFCSKGGIEIVEYGVALQAERMGAVGDGVPDGEDEDGRGEQSRKSHTMTHISGVRIYFAPCFSGGPNALGLLRQKLLLETETSEERVQLLQVFEHENFGEGRDLVGVKANAGGGDGLAERFDFGSDQVDHGQRNLEIIRAKTLEKCSDGADVFGKASFEDDDVVQVRDQALQIVGGLINDHHEPPWRGVDAF